MTVGATRCGILWGCAMFVTVLALYWPCRNFSFVRLDDQEYVYQNEHIKEGIDGKCVKWAFSDVGYASNWHPFTWLSHAGDVSLARAAGMEIDVPSPSNGSWTAVDGTLAHMMHLHNVVLHAANAALLFLLIVRICGLGSDEHADIAIAALAALIWAVHPLRCEAVCWVSERKELIATFFMLLSFLAFLGRNNTAYILSVTCFSLALLAKPVAVSLPAALFAYDIGVRRERFGRAALRISTFAVLATGVCVLTMSAQTDAREIGNTAMDWVTRMVSAVEAPTIYLRQFAWPAGLCSLYETRQSVDWLHFIAGVILLAAMGLVIVHWFRRRGPMDGLGVFAIAWCYVGLIPMLGIVKVGGQPHSDRYTYWIGCGLAVIAAMLLMRCVRGLRNAGARHALVAVLLMLAVAYAIVGTVRIGVWRDSLSLYADAVRNTSDEDSAMILADEMCRRGAKGTREAIMMLREVLSIRHTPKARAGLALFMAMHYREAGETSLEEARMFANDALAVDASCGEAYAALGFADIAEGNLRSAAAHMREAFAHGYTNSRIASQIENWR